MKTISLIIIMFMSVSIASANTDANEEVFEKQCLLEYQDFIVNFNVEVDLRFLPYTMNQRACMKKVTSQGEYSLWKVPADEVISYQSVEITGRSYNYFVYKENQFHFTVNESNKNHVYNFFTGNE